MRALIFACTFLLGPALVSAQSLPTPGNVTVMKVVAWDPIPVESCNPLCQYRVEVDGVTVNTTVELSLSFPAPLMPGLHSVSVTAIDGQGNQSVRSYTHYYETARAASAPPGPCQYQPPVTAQNPTPPMETRPIGQRMQGFNPIGPSGIVNNQADRLRQLQAWGWRVAVAQFVEGNLRADKIDRLFLIVECEGVTE